MLPVLLSTAYAPPISWVRAAMGAPIVYIEAYETYPRQTYRNRCRIITANGILELSVPVKKLQGNSTHTKDIRIAYDEPWQRIHLRGINAAYSNSPFYLYYMDELHHFYEKKYVYLLEFNTELTRCVFNLLGLKSDFIMTEEYQHFPIGQIDLRNEFSPKKEIEAGKFRHYTQVFMERHGFAADLSILDLLFNEGPAAKDLLISE